MKRNVKNSLKRISDRLKFRLSCLHGSLLPQQCLTSYTCQVTEACLEAGCYTIPFTGSSYGRSSKRVPGLVEFVKPHRKTSMFWYNLSVECGSSRNETVHDIMRRTRANYHHAIRSVKRSKDQIIRVRFVEALLRDNYRDFCGEVKKLRCNKLLCSNVVVD